MPARDDSPQTDPHDPTSRTARDLTGAPNELRPIPDPTALTTAQLNREVYSLQRYIEAQIGGKFDIVVTRFAEYDKAVKLLQDFANKSPTIDVVDGKIKALMELHGSRMDGIDALIVAYRESTSIRLAQLDKQPEMIAAAISQLAILNTEKFSSIQTQFIERDIRQNALSLADKTAVAAALQAQKEQAGATNDSNTIAITKMENNFAALIKSGADQLQQLERTLNDKINDVKDRALASEGKDTGHANSWSQIGQVGMFLIALAAVLVSFLRH